MSSLGKEKRAVCKQRGCLFANIGSGRQVGCVEDKAVFHYVAGLLRDYLSLQRE